MYVSDSYSPIGDAQAFVDNGFDGCMRYLRLGSGGGELTADERDRIWAVGAKIGLNHESTADAWRGGAEAGKRAGGTANADADRLAFPDHRPIYYTPVDQGGGSIDLVREYLIAAHGEGPRPVGLYWGVPMIEQFLDEGVISFGWIAGATSWSRPRHPENGDVGRSTMFQRVGNYNIGGTAIDLNDVLRPDWGGYNPNASPTPAPIQEDDEMRVGYAKRVSDGVEFEAIIRTDGRFDYRFTDPATAPHLWDNAWVSVHGNGGPVIPFNVDTVIVTVFDERFHIEVRNTKPGEENARIVAQKGYGLPFHMDPTLYGSKV